jgi:putative DNA primase/helicase
MYDNNNSNNGHSANTGSFDIRDHLDKLEPGKGKDAYTCPVCQGKRLTFDKETGAYQCWSGGCSTTEIKEAIRPLAEFLAERNGEKPAPKAKKPRVKKKEQVPVPIPIGAKLLRLPAPGQSPQPQPLAKDTPKDIPRNARQFTYDYSPTQKVVRYEWPDATNPKGHDKTYRQFHLDPNGKKVWKKGEARWPAYRIDEVVEILETIPDDEVVAVAMPEGELSVELARNIRLAALTLQGSNWSDPETQQMLETLRATGKNVCLVVIRDNDDTGIKKGKGIELVARHIQFPCLVLDPRVICSDIPEKGDIREILEAMEADEFLIRVESELFKAGNSLTPNIFLNFHPRTQEDVVYLESSSSTPDYISDSALIPEQNYVQKAVEALYSSNHWASIAGQLYEFTGTHYELRPEAIEKRRILDWLSTYSEFVKGKYRCTRANSASVNEVYSYVLMREAIDPSAINPDGLNCTNGVVKINPDGSHLLVPHNPKQVYTYVGCRYDPSIDVTDGDRFLECLEPSEREIFLRTAAAGLNLKLVRSKLTGRGVKGLLCQGEGSNGKDTARAILAAVFGRGMTGKSLSDFKSYDNGRKFSLAGIEGSICNWASENTAKVDLDNLQSLKQFITGDILDIERKGKDGYEYKPAAIFFANCNKLPSITGGTAAIDDRYGILRFNKTYKRNADLSRGELEADARFKDDEKFIFEQIAPAMLNKMLERLPLLLVEGIDYTATREAMREAQEESRHLWQFVRDLGYEAGKGERVYAKDLWSELQDWYQEAGILEIEYSDKGKEKLIWNELPNQWDKPVKAINQLYARLCEIFPKLEKYRYTESVSDSERIKGEAYYLGISKVNLGGNEKSSSPSSPPCSTVLSSSPPSSPGKIGEDGGEARIFMQRAGEDGEAINPTFAEVCKLVSQFTDAERQKLRELLNPSHPREIITPEDAQAIRDIALVWWPVYYPEQKQSLVTQMYGRQAPGSKYSTTTLNVWLETEAAEIRDRITELISLRGK